MPNLSELAAHPKTFLKRNALWVAGGLNVKMQGKADQKVWPVKLVPRANTVCRDGNDAVIPCYDVVEATSLSDATLCYFLPFVLNHTREMTLGDKANLFFTDTMTGCAFGAMNGPAPKVAHLNYTVGKVEGALIDQATVGAEMSKVFAGAPQRQLRKDDYKDARAPDANVTVVGVRRPGGQWDFVYQRRNREGMEGRSALYRMISIHTVK